MMFINTVKYADLKPGECRAIEAEGGQTIALFNVNGDIYALDNTCPHAGGPLGEGCLDGEVVKCPWHGWKFNVRTGQCLKNPIPEWSVPSYPVRVENGVIQVSLSKKD